MKERSQNVSSITLDILNSNISFQPNTWSSISKEITIKDALIEIQSSKYKEQVSKLRDVFKKEQNDEYNYHKKTLPAVTFCGTFDAERKKTKIKKYNSIIVLDIDKLDNPELGRTKNHFLSDPIVFAFWESPSKAGLKGLVLLKFNLDLNEANIDAAHKSAFRKLAKYFKDSYEIFLDASGSDTTRLCYFSYDPDLVIKETITPFEINEDDLSILATREIYENSNVEISPELNNRNALYNPKDRNKPSDRYTIAAIIKCLEKKKSSITFSYEEWYKVAMAIANSFTYEVGEKYFLKLSSFDTEKYDEINCKNYLLDCYQTRSGAITFSTMVYLANKKNYQTKKQRDRGSEATDENLA